MRRLTRILLWTAGAILTLVLVTAAVTETTFFKQWLRGVIVRQANQRLNGTLSIGRLSGGLYSGIELDDVTLMMEGEKIVAIDAVKASYSIRELVSGGVTIDSVTLVHPVIAVRRDGDGWQFARLVRKEAQESDRQGPKRPINVRHIDITNGAFAIDKQPGPQTFNYPARIDRFNAAMSFAYAPVHFTVGINSLSFAGSDPELAMQEISGAISVKDNNINFDKLTVRTAETRAWIDGAVVRGGDTPTLALKVSLAPLSLPEVHRLAPAMKDMHVAPNIVATLSGPTSRLATEVSVRSDAGDFAYKGTVGIGGPDRVVQGELAVHHLDLAPFLDNPEQKSDIVVYAKVDLRGPAGFDSLRGTVAGDAPIVQTHGYFVSGIRVKAKIDGRKITFDTSEHAYRADTTAAGSVEFASDQNPVTRFDLTGIVKDVGVAYLPAQMRVPPAESNVTASYHVKIDIPRAPGWRLSGDVVLADSTVAGVDVAKGATAAFAFGPDLVQYQVDMNVAGVNLKRIGDQFNIAALQNPRYETSLDGHVTARVSGTTLETVDLAASGAITNASAFGGQIKETTFETALAHDALHVKASGQVDGINPAIAGDRPALDGSISGAVAADITFSHLSKGVALDSVEGDLTADLGPSRMGDVIVDKAYVAGDYRHAVADIYELNATGADVVATGHGTLAFNDTDKSGFWLHAEASRLESVSTAVHAESAVTGIGTVDVVVGGNKKEFTVNGTATGNGLKYADYGALAASTTFAARIPDLDVQRAVVTADSHATFVELAGVEVNDLTAKTEYRDQDIAFSTTATQPRRALTADGVARLRPDEKEVRVKALTFATEGMTWQIGQGHSPTITYSAKSVGVKDLSLVSGRQEIRAEGAIGGADDALTVNMSNVDLGVVDAWLLRPPQLSGAVTAKAVVSGEKSAPHVEADFTIAKGKFRDLPYESFAGTVTYAPARLVMDTRLQQDGAQWLTAKGELPVSLFRGPKSGADTVDFHIDSSNVDLGIVQGLTSAISGVKGTLQAKLDLTGTSAEPRVTGGMSVRGGAFKVEDTGVSYARLDGRVEFLPDRVHINDLHVLDSGNQSLSLTGDLGVSGFDISTANLGVYADNFQVLGNEMGTLRVDTNLELTGTLAHPKLEGDLALTTGSLNLDPILARLNNSAYSTTAVDLAEAEEADRAPQPGMLGPLEVAVRLTMPDDLVVKASDLRTSSGGPIGLGSMNITLGGDLNVSAGPARPVTLVGSVKTIRGFYSYQGRRFTIQRDGTVRFEGDAINRLDPSLDVSAERVIQAVTARVNVRGRLRRPDIQLTSTPPLDQADILALIVFNQPLNELGEGQQLSLAQRAGSMAAGAVTNQLTGSIANSLNLDQFEINLSPDSGNTAELTVGQQLGQNLYVKVQTGMGDHSQANFVLEYEFAKWLRLQSNVLEGSTTEQQLFQPVQSTGLDLVFSFSFK